MTSSLITPFNQNHTISYYHTLHLNFWNTEFEMESEFKIFEELLLFFKKINPVYKETIRASYDILKNPEKKKEYNLFLFYNYVLSQPFSLHQLKEKFKNKIFPYYLFTIFYKSKYHQMIIDYIKLELVVQGGEKIFQTIKAYEIVYIEMKEEQIIINAPKKIKRDSWNSSSLINTLTIIPEFIEQIEFIYLLLKFLLQTNEVISSSTLKESIKGVDVKELSEEENKEANYERYKEIIKDFEILKDDIYIPSGAILKGEAIKTYRSDGGPGKRYIVLGASQLILFKDEAMSVICNVIPFIPFHTIIKFEDEAFSVKFILDSREQSIVFANSDIYTIWKSTLINITERKLFEVIEDRAIIDIELEKNDNNPTVLLDKLDEEIEKVNKEIDAMKKREDQIKNDIKELK